MNTKQYVIKTGKYWAGFKFLATLSLSVLLFACGGGTEGDDTGLSARLNPDASPASSPSFDNGTSTEAGTSTTPVVSSSLSLDLNAPAQVTFGAAIIINPSVTNAQGNVSYTLLGAPQGMTIDSTSGEINWTPSGLSFGKDTLFNYRLRVTDDTGSISSMASSLVATNSTYPLVRSSARVPTKQNAIHIGDFNGDADNEVLVTDNISLIYTLKWDASLNQGEGDFYQEWVYPWSLGDQASIDAIDAADINDDGRLDIIVLNGHRVSVIDGLTRTLIYSYDIAGAVRGYAVFARNIDGDAAIEIVTLVSKGAAQEQLDVFTIPSASSQILNNDWTSAVENYGTAMVIANMDFSDPQLEIATSSGYVFDGVSLENEWAAAKPTYGFGDQLVAADLDGDSIKEIIGLYSGSGSGEIEVFSLHEQSGLFGNVSTNREPETTACAMAVIDSNDNDQDEVYIGECVDGGAANGELLNILSAANQASFSETLLYRQTVDERLHAGFVSLTVGDADNDGDLDMVWANNASNDKYDSITVADLDASLVASSMVIAKQNITLGLFDTAFTGAVDYLHAGTTHYATFMSNIEPVEGGDNSYSRESRFAFIDYTSGRVSLSSYISATKTVVSGQKIMAADIVGAGYDQLVFSSAFTRNSIEYSSYQVVDYGGDATPAIELTHAGWIPASNNPLGGLQGNLSTAFDLANLDDDAELELTGFIDNYLFSYDLIPASQNWQSIRLDGEGIDVVIDDINADGINDLVHLTDSNLYIRQRDDDSQHQTSNFYDTLFLFRDLFQAASFTAMQLVDINSDGEKEIIVSATTVSGGTIYLLDNNAMVLAEFSIDGEVTDFQLGQTERSVLVAWKDKAASGAIATAYVSEFAISRDMQFVTEVMRSPALLGEVSSHSMNYSDDGRLLVGTRYGMYITR